MTEKNRAALYARVSTDEQALQGYSLETQIEKMRMYCEINDLVIAGEGVDACYSYLAVVKSPSGARRVIVSGIDLLSPTPEGAYLLDALVAYQTMR